MAEPKTAVLLSAPKSAGSEQKSKKPARSLRFELTLQETTKETYSEFSYLDLVSKEKEKHVRHKVKANGVHPPDDPFGDSDDNVKEIARRFEEKYGTGDGMQRKKHRDVSELGQGYDENDPFIDNSDVHEEDLPSNQRPEFGGFYINRGALRLELIDGADPGRPPPARRKRVRRLSSDADDDVTTGEEQEPGVKRPRKRLGRPPKKDPSLLQKKKRRAIDGLLKKKPSLTVKELLEQKKAHRELQRAAETPPPAQPPAAAAEPAAETVNAAEAPTNGTAQTNGHDGSRDSMDETIAHVVAAAARQAGSSPATGGAERSSPPPPPAARKPERCRRPSEDDLPHLTPELAQLVTAIKAAAELAGRSGEGKMKFFTPEVNKMLLNIELRCQQELRRNDRQAVYLHLAAHLPCGTQTLIKRAKQLVLDEEKTVIRRPLNRLKESIAATMPGLKERYAEDCKKVMEAKELPMPDSKKAEQPAGAPDAKPPALPRKRFRWNDTTREHLHRVIEVRAHSFKMLKKRQGSVEEFLKTFLDTDVLPLWEKGWMTGRELMKRCLPVFQEEIKKKTRPGMKVTGTPPRKVGRPPSDSGSRHAARTAFATTTTDQSGGQGGPRRLPTAGAAASGRCPLPCRAALTGRRPRLPLPHRRRRRHL
ncbi:Ubinuclein-2 [Amphibalanus amphitrite]|uniref:Ubinuclein-2 n=1 Tax=Amphibalanus amphitrite TaxID=1232801 RepID=A0A6A4WUQ4_AMPAM|nr:Ubinuclein-2 [Amphibalanus amphitrite]